MKLRSKLNYGFTNRNSLHYAILKAYKATDVSKSEILQNIQNEIFKILKIYKYIMTFTRQPVELLKKTQQKEKHHIHDILILSLLLVIIMV